MSITIAQSYKEKMKEVAQFYKMECINLGIVHWIWDWPFSLMKNQ